MSITMIVRRITERRAKALQGIYIGCAGVAVVLGLVAVGMQGGAVVMLPYLLIIGLCVSPFVRPALLGWFVLTVAFGSYTAGIAANRPDHKSVLALLLIALPTAFLVLEVNRSQSIKIKLNRSLRAVKSPLMVTMAFSVLG